MNDKATFFTSAQRNLLTYELLRRIHLDEPGKSGMITFNIGTFLLVPLYIGVSV